MPQTTLARQLCTALIAVTALIAAGSFAGNPQPSWAYLRHIPHDLWATAAAGTLACLRWQPRATSWACHAVAALHGPLPERWHARDRRAAKTGIES